MKFTLFTFVTIIGVAMAAPVAQPAPLKARTGGGLVVRSLSMTTL